MMVWMGKSFVVRAAFRIPGERTLPSKAYDLAKYLLAEGVYYYIP